MDLAHSVGQFPFELPLIPVPAKFFDCPLGNRLSLVLGQAQAQSLHDLPRSDQGVADGVGEEVATGHCEIVFAVCSDEGITLRRFIG
jgi:hypothetical protein